MSSTQPDSDGSAPEHPPAAPGQAPEAADRPAVAPGQAAGVKNRSVGAAARRFVLVAGVAAALGVPYGLLWSVLAPTIPVIKVDGGLVPAAAEPEEFIAGDGWFVLLGACFGVLAAVAAWLLGRRVRGPVAVAVLALGAVAGGVLAWWLGQRIGVAGYERELAVAAVGTRLDHPPVLRVKQVEWRYGLLPDVRGVLLTEALLAVLAYTLLAGWSRFASLRPGSERRLSSGWSAPPDPPTAPGLPVAGEAGPSRG